MVTRLEMAARKSLDRRIVIELLELRLGFEPEAAALAMRRADATQLARIGEAYGFMRESAAGN
jgi:DNA-binding FadR family transcriptional regulator